jgi:hypothetical protein
MPSDEELEKIFGQAQNSMVHGAIAMHELFLSFIEAGFTEAQALTLVIEVMKGS